MGLIPSFVWLWFFRKEDLRPEPRRLIFMVFISGALSTILAFLLQNKLACPVIQGCEEGIIISSQLTLSGWITLAAIEEIIKFLAAFFVVYHNAEFDEPIDAMIYMVTAALGFAAVENIASLWNSSQEAALRITDIVSLLLIRMGGATLLHALSSAIVGYYWAMSIIKFKTITPLFTGFIIATGLHSVFNLLIMSQRQLIFPGQLAFSVLLLIIAGFFVINDFEKLRYRKI